MATRQPSRISKILSRMQAVGGVAARSCAKDIASAKRLLALVQLLDDLDLVLQKVEFDYHSRFTPMQHGHMLVTLRKAAGASFGIIFAKSRLVDPATGAEFKSLHCRRMKYQGIAYNVRGCINGDVLVEVNGVPVTTSKELMYEVIGDANAVVLKVNRSLPRALDIAGIEALLEELTAIIARFDTLPIPAPNAPDNMQDAEVALLE